MRTVPIYDRRYSFPYDPARDWPTRPRARCTVQQLSDEAAGLMTASWRLIAETCPLLQDACNEVAPPTLH
jgi:hypothetical protein